MMVQKIVGNIWFEAALQSCQNGSSRKSAAFTDFTFHQIILEYDKNHVDL
jgi:DNA-binding FadR family transcriptional regulator